MGMRTIWALACLLLSVAACGTNGGDGPAATSTVSSPATTSATPSRAPTASPTAAPEPSPSLGLPKDAPATLDAPLSVVELTEGDFADLAPPGATVTFTDVLATPDDPVDQVAVAWRRGEDPFASEQGFVVWQRFAADPPWRAVYAFTDRPPSGVLGISLETGDLTADGLPEIVTFEQVGGTGACGTWRVIAPRPGGASEIHREETCDVQIQIADGALERREAVYGPDDPHCCPSAFRVSRLEWDGETFVQTERHLLEPTA